MEAARKEGPKSKAAVYAEKVLKAVSGMYRYGDISKAS